MVTAGLVFESHMSHAFWILIEKCTDELCKCTDVCVCMRVCVLVGEFAYDSAWVVTNKAISAFIVRH